MLIGGYDLTFPTTIPAHAALEVATNTILSFWKEGVVEVEIGKNAKNSSVLDRYEGDLPEDSTHIFVYQNKESYQAWKTEGWNEAWAHGMIYLSMYEGEFNCVLENPEDSRLKPIAEAIRKSLL
jgi:hypothetical protein